MLLVPHLADGGAAIDMHLADLARAQPDLGIVAFPGEQLYRGAGGARQLRALAGHHLDAMYGGADRDIPQRKRIAGLDRRLRARNDLRTRGNALGRDNVATLAVGVAQQCEKRAAVGIVLKTLDLRRNAVLVALEIDLSVQLLVATALVAHGDLAMHVAAAPLVLTLDEVRHRT